MTTAKQIAKSLTSLAQTHYGAKYHKVDFHLHTPASEDARGSNRYGFNPYKTIVYPETNDHSWAYVQAVRQAQEATLEQARELAAQLVERFVEEGLRMVAITDHNSLGTIWPDPETRDMDLAAPTWYELIDDAAAQRCESQGESVVILPGVEISTTGVHILAIFPPTRPRRQVHFRICDLLSEIGIGVDEFGSNPARGHASPADAIDLIHHKGGVPIIAHIDGSDKALLEQLEIGSSELADVLCRPQLHCVEMVNPDKLLSVPKSLAKQQTTLGQWIERERVGAGLDGLAFFQGSDAHDLAAVGKRYSYLMMSEPSFAGLYNAIHSPSSRVRVGELAGELAHDALYLYGFELEHPLFGSASARFNRNLNCVVGATDCGKSLLLGLLRHAVDEQSKLDGTVKLFLERHRDGATSHYCFTRRGDAVELFELSADENGEFEAKPVAAEHPDHQALRPRFYDPARMHEVIGSPDGLQEFLIAYTGCGPSEASVAAFNQRFDFPRFLSATPDPLLQLRLDDEGGLSLSLNSNWRRGRPKLCSFDNCNDSLKRLMVMIIVLVSGRSGPVIIDEPADVFDNADITHYLVPLLKLLKGNGQMILATKNASLAVTADPENYLVLDHATRGKFKVTIESGFAIDQQAQRERLLALLEGDRDSFKRRGVLYGGELQPA